MVGSAARRVQLHGWRYFWRTEYLGRPPHSLVCPWNEESLTRQLSALRGPVITADLPQLLSLDVISKSQFASPSPSDAGFSLTSNLSSDLWMSTNGKIYIAENDEELQLRICVAALCGHGGHGGLTATTNIVKQKLHWSTVDFDIKVFVQSCLVCTLSSSCSKVPRPLGQQIHAERVS